MPSGRDPELLRNNLFSQLHCRWAHLPDNLSTCCLPVFMVWRVTSTLKMEAECSPETSVSAYKTTRCHNPEAHILKSHRCKSFEFDARIPFLTSATVAPVPLSGPVDVGGGRSVKLAIYRWAKNVCAPTVDNEDIQRAPVQQYKYTVACTVVGCVIGG
jgi:hypothetical protein